MKRAWTPFLVVAALLFSIAGHAGEETSENHILFAGGDFDSTEQASPWIQIRGANRVVIRTWSSHAAFHAETDADSTRSDSIAVFKVLFSDSVSFMGRDSAGTLVTASSTFPYSASHGKPFPVCVDTIVIDIPTSTARTDTLSKQVGVFWPPYNKALRGPANGHGLYTTVVPIAPTGVAAYGDGSFGTQYMRVRITPLRRLTVTGGQSTAGKRVNGLKGMRMTAQVIWKNK